MVYTCSPTQSSQW